MIDASPFSASAATLLAAAVAALGSVAATVIGAVNAAKSRRRSDREQWWTRFVWAIDRSTSRLPEESELGLRVLLDLIRTRWTSAEDNETAIAVADLIAARGTPVEQRKRGRRHG